MLTAIIVAGGSSRRMGFDKTFAPLAGRPVIAHTISAFAAADCVAAIVVVGRADRLDELRALPPVAKVREFLAGGEHRQDSVAQGLKRLPDRTRFVAVHDAARPLVTAEEIRRVFEAAQEHGAAALAAPITDTLKRATEAHIVCGSVDRERLFAMQTPQVFAREWIEEAYARVFSDKVPITDEVSAIEHLGRQVVLVSNTKPNFKITYPEDLALAESVLARRDSTSR